MGEFKPVFPSPFSVKSALKKLTPNSFKDSSARVSPMRTYHSLLPGFQAFP